MGLNHSPKIVTNGLVLCLDAASQKSYPGSGTTWTDLSGKGNNGTLVNGVGYNSGNLGSLVFDGVDDLCRTTLPVSTLSSIFTVCVFFNLTSLTSSNPNAVSKRLISADASSGNTKWCIGVTPNSDFLFAGSGGSEKTLRFPISLNQIYFVALTHNTSTYSLWLNNETKILNDSSNINASSFGNISIACRPNTTDRLWTGNVFSCSIYNRVLSGQEIQQNFNALKGRFGLT
jgi:hypothetical protein